MGTKLTTTASRVRPGDTVRGIGLTVDYSEPQSDYTWSIVGHVTDEEDSVFSGVNIVLPNDAKVKVDRPFAVGDIVQVPDGDEDVVVLWVYEPGEYPSLTVAYEDDPHGENAWGVYPADARHVGLTRDDA